jgi:plastocyanin
VPARYPAPRLAALAAATSLAALAACSRDALEQRMSTADSVRADDPVWKSTRPPRPEIVSMTEPNVVTVTARDYAFDAPAQLPAGFTTIRLVNEGGESHNLQLVRVEGRHSSGDLITALSMGQPRPDWAVDAGGPNQAAPKDTSNATFLLEPGDYAIICPIMGPDGKPHVMKGMARPLTVTREGARIAPAPIPDLTMTLVDYGFDVKQPIEAGERTIRVTNDGEQPHEVLLVRLAPGRRAQDYAAWYAKQSGAAPGELMGGISSIAPGTEATVTADLQPGTYALLCLIPDAKDGRPHVAHGMIREIRVT